MRVSDTPLIAKEAIQARIAELAQALDTAYVDRDPLFMCVLKGGVFFTTDLLRAMQQDPEIDFVRARSYEGTQSSGDVIFHVLPETDVEDRHIVLLEDILDTGRTCATIKDWCLSHGAASVALCTLLDKPARRIVPIEAEYVGFTIDDHFVVGYGLDVDERYRNLPELFILEEG